MSTGMTSEEELDCAYKLLKEQTERIAILHCVSSYPLEEIYANLNKIHKLKKKYDHKR